MMRRFAEIGPLNRHAARQELEDIKERNLAGAIVFGDIRNGIRLVWEISYEAPRGALLQPHEARALGEALIAAADDVAAYKVQP